MPAHECCEHCDGLRERVRDLQVALNHATTRIKSLEAWHEPNGGGAWDA